MIIRQLFFLAIVYSLGVQVDSAIAHPGQGGSFPVEDGDSFEFPPNYDVPLCLTDIRSHPDLLSNTNDYMLGLNGRHGQCIQSQVAYEGLRNAGKIKIIDDTRTGCILWSNVLGRDASAIFATSNYGWKPPGISAGDILIGKSYASQSGIGAIISHEIGHKFHSELYGFSKYFQAESIATTFELACDKAPSVDFSLVWNGTNIPSQPGVLIDTEPTANRNWWDPSSSWCFYIEYSWAGTQRVIHRTWIEHSPCPGFGGALDQ